MIMQEEEVKEKVAKMEYAEQCLITIRSGLKVSSYHFDLGALKINGEDFTAGFRVWHIF